MYASILVRMFPSYSIQDIFIYCDTNVIFVAFNSFVLNDLYVNKNLWFILMSLMHQHDVISTCAKIISMCLLIYIYIGLLYYCIGLFINKTQI